MRSVGIATFVFAALASLAAGCGKSDTSEEGSDKVAPADEPVKTKAAPTKQSLKQALGASKTPALFGPYTGAAFGMTKEEFAKASPVFAEHGDYLSKNDYGVGYYASIEGKPTKRFGALLVSIKLEERADVTAAWGPGKELTYRTKPATIWIDPATQIRARLTDDGKEGKITIDSYLPASKILGANGAALGIEVGKPFLGATPDELKAAYPEHMKRIMKTLVFMKWPPSEYGDQFNMELRLEDGKVERLQFWLHHGENPDIKKTLLALLEAKYGPGKPVKTVLGSKRLQLSKTPKVLVGETKGSWVITVGAE